jgi:pimeloyl-ACP methyl ester carboxylesterase
MAVSRSACLHRSLALLALLPGLAIAGPAPSPEGPPPHITIGTLTLDFCNTDYDGYCGSIERPLDPKRAASGTITIGFEYYPRRDASSPSLGVIVPQEGGPGYPSTGTRDAYVNIFDPLRDHRDILIIDKRGTGTSGAIDCRRLQRDDPSDPQALAACGRQLGKTAALYRTELAVADIVGVLDALEIAQIDFYGDSYGTYVGQTFAARHGQRLRSLILDSAYPVRPPDIWFPTDWARGRDGLDRVCERSPSCRALGGQSTSRIRALLGYLRQHTISGTAPDTDGILTDTTLDVSTLFNLITNLGNSPITYRELDAATRAWFETRDSLPLLRLTAEFNTESVTDAVDFSWGLFQDVVCEEYPLHYDLTASPAQRRRQYARAIDAARSERPDLFAPFTIDEALASEANFTPLATCLDWPEPIPTYPQGDALPANPVFPTVPTLVLSGDLDSVTSVEDAAQVVELFPNVRHLIVPNLTHVTAWFFSDVGLLPDGGDTTHCVQDIVRRFVEQLTPGDTRCVAKVRPIRTVPRFAKTSAALAPVDAVRGNRADRRALQLASGALETAGDVFARFLVTFGIGSGLRGGEFTYVRDGEGYTFTLDAVKWTEDLAVSGTMTWNLRTGVVTADLKLKQYGKPIGRLDIEWNDIPGNSLATLEGTIGGERVRARRIAP